jgi:thymidine kinase
MSLRIVVGPMFAGKTTEIQSVVRRSECLGPVLVLTADIDTRYGGDAVISHDKVALPARPVAVDALYGVLTWPEFAAAKVIVVDEAQFFVGLIDFVTAAVDRYGKHVVVVGLDGDAERRPFGEVLALAAHADVIEKKTALCRRCGDGTAAIFTKAVGRREDRVTVGGANIYEPMCRRHYNNSLII